MERVNRESEVKIKTPAKKDLKMQAEQKKLKLNKELPYL